MQLGAGDSGGPRTTSFKPSKGQGLWTYSRDTGFFGPLWFSAISVPPRGSRSFRMALHSSGLQCSECRDFSPHCLPGPGAGGRAARIAITCLNHDQLKAQEALPALSRNVGPVLTPVSVTCRHRLTERLVLSPIPSGSLDWAFDQNPAGPPPVTQRKVGETLLPHSSLPVKPPPQLCPEPSCAASS